MKKTNTYKIVKEKTDIEQMKVQNGADINKYVRKFYHEDIEIYESMFLVLLNRANITEGFVKISQGGTAGTVVDIKIIAKYAVDSLCSSVILCHNHPSGNIHPSQQDKNLTAKVKAALDFFDIQLLDHVIITGEHDKYYSFVENCLI